MIRHSAEYLKIRLQILAQIHYGCDIAATVTIVGCGPNGNNVFVFEMVLRIVSCK